MLNMCVWYKVTCINSILQKFWENRNSTVRFSEIQTCISSTGKLWKLSPMLTNPTESYQWSKNGNIMWSLHI